MRIYVGVTDNNWYENLKKNNCEEANFWRPKEKTFRALNEGEIFLFKLHHPLNFIVGGGVFFKYTALPLSVAWKSFQLSNGANSISNLQKAILKYNNTINGDPLIGCIILTNLFFLDKTEWIPVPADWKSNIVQGKIYNTDSTNGLFLYNSVIDKISSNSPNEHSFYENHEIRYGSPQIIKPRIGQGSFKILISDVYKNCCAITGERAIPVLEAAHIKPYSNNGPHTIENGLLLRSDIHTLFDRGYITISDDLTIKVSSKIHAFGASNYLQYDGCKLSTSRNNLPGKEYLKWHQNNIYLG